MALVAFPFASCITSEDVDDNVFDSFGVSRQQKAEEDEHQQHPQCNDNDAEMADTNDSDSAFQQSSATASTFSSAAAEEEKDTGAEIDDLFFQNLDNDDEDDGGAGDIDSASKTNELDADVAMDIDDEVATTDTHSLGGLNNLGNTCYLASALQMINSLPGLVEELKKTTLPREALAAVSSSNKGEEMTDNSKAKTLRDCLIEVLESLNRGETVSPREFKDVIDERTPLFVGFRQQDAHELLSTLIDLLDEDYKKKVEQKENQDEDEIMSSPEEAGESCQESKGEVEEDCTESDAPAKTQSFTEVPVSPQNEDRPECYESATKKPRNTLDEKLPVASPMETISTMRPAHRCQSFSELKPEGIEELLHGALASSKPAQPLASPSSPRCKLIGGRMTAVDAICMTIEDSEDVSTMPVAKACEIEAPGDDHSKTSPVDSYFRMEVRVRLTCDSCKYTRTHLENFLHLSLEIGPDSCSVADGLRKFFAPEKRELKCEKCFCESAHRTMEVTRLPKALLLHFKRFIVDVSPDYTSITYRKNQSDVFFEDTLLLDEDKGGVLGEFFAKVVCMPNFEGSLSSADDDDKDHSYQIRSVVNHIGSSANCGHYTADAARLHPNGKRIWTRFNDSYVSKITAKEAIEDSAQTAYMVMYELSH